MSTILEYVKNAHARFKDEGLNEADAMVFSALANMDLSRVVSGTVPLRTVAQAMIQDSGECSPEDLALLAFCAGSPRFADVQVDGAVCEIDKKIEKQFGAVIFHMTPQSAYVGFMGTGDSIVGYKEDLNMGYMDIIPSQQAAVAYLNKAAGNLPETIYLGGHSKGGNLAVFAGAFCQPDVRKKIQAVYNHDGPGFNQTILDEPKYQTLLPLVHTYIPEASVVGLILEHNNDFEVVKSLARPLAQHVIYTWVLDGDRPVILEKISPVGLFMQDVISNLIDEIPPEQAEARLSALFKLVDSVKADTWTEFAARGAELLPKISSAWENSDAAEKQQIKAFAKDYATALFKSVKRFLKNKKDA